MDSEKAAIIATSDDEHEEIEEEEEADGKVGEDSDQVAVGAVLRNPQVMAALQARLDSMVGHQSGYVKVHETCFRKCLIFKLTALLWILTGVVKLYQLCLSLLCVEVLTLSFSYF